MPRRIDLIGVEVPKWKIESYFGESKWNLRCDTCGQLSQVYSKAVRHKVNIACRKCGLTHNSKHGHAVRGQMSDTYRSWESMKKRCKNGPGWHAYHLYAGRGIKVCDRWMDFNNFLADMGERPHKKANIDRIDNNLGYSPENCRWATSRENQQNRRNNKWVIFNGRKMVLAEVVRTIGIRRHVLSGKMKKMQAEIPDVTEIAFFSGKSIPIEIRHRASC